MNLLAIAALLCLQDDGADSFLKFGVGTRWTVATSYSDIDRKVESEITVIESKPGSMVTEMAYTDNGKAGPKKTQTWTEREGLIWANVIAVHKPGSKAGDEWTYTIGDHSFTVVHRGVEPVTVPAGAFPRAIRLHHRGPAATLDFQMWIVPGTGIVKTVTTNKRRSITEELKEFKPAGGAPRKDPRPAAPPVSDAEMDALFFQAKLQAAEAHLKSGRKEKAIELLEDLIKTCPTSPLLGEARRLLEAARK